MKLPKTWSDIKTKDFIAVYKITSSPDYTNETERLIDIAATLLNVPVSELDSLELEALYKLDFLLHPEKIPAKVPHYFWLKGKLYRPLLNIQKQWTSGNYIDVSEYTKDPAKIIDNMHRLMAAVCLPCNWLGKAKKYNAKETEKRAQVFYQSLPITITYPVTLFFCNNLRSLIRATQTYLESRIMEEMTQLKDMLPAGAGSLPSMPSAMAAASTGITGQT